MVGQTAAAHMAWDESLSTGVDSLDVQHKALFDCMNVLEEATQERSMMRTCYVLEQLSGYVHNHFADEERQMRMHDYPGLADHIREHREFTNRLHDLRRTYLDRDIKSDLVALLRDWLVQHVAGADMDYVPYLTPERRLDLPMMSADAATTARSLARH